MQQEIIQCAKLKDFDALQSYTNDLPTQDQLAKKLEELTTSHKVLDELVHKSYASKFYVVEEQKDLHTRIKYEFISKHDYNG